MSSTETSGATTHDITDVVVVGAGFAGMYLLHRLRGLGATTRVLEAGGDVGGTWYWNRYPGARCDIPSIDYSYSFDPELDETWEWSEKYAAQPEILRYANHVADRLDLRRDIDFDTRVAAAVWNDSARRWTITTSNGEAISARHFVMATGCLSVPKEIDIAGVERFAGEVYLTGRWPHEGVDFSGKRVAVVGTGSSAIQSIPLIAEQAAELVVFQRTPNFSMPAHNGPIPAAKLDVIRSDRRAYRERAKWSQGGVPSEPATVSALAVAVEERQATYERTWSEGGMLEFLGSYNDHLSNPAANELLAEFVRGKIRSIVADPEIAEALCPTSYPIGTKRMCVDTGYYDTYNRPNVRLVDLRRRPIVTITETGLELADELLEFDAIVFATGFDAMTGAVVAVDITGRDGTTLTEAWAGGPETYLGLMVEGFPNLFLVTGPGSPSVLTNMMVSIEQHVDWVTDCIADLRDEGLDSIEPTPRAVEGWVRHVNDYAALTLMPRADSWYMGANVPGKPRVFLPYPGGVGRYRTTCDEVVERGYLGFVRRGPGVTIENDGVVRRVAPDVQIMLDTIAALGVPPLDSMTPSDARTFSDAAAAYRAPGPAVAAMIDGTLPGADGPLAFRSYTPEAAGPRPIVVWFHGGGWVIGGPTSDEPFCRALCAATGAVVVSVDYRHGPEHRFPSASDDALAATRWIADHAADFGGDGRIVLAGWSAGGNLAAVVAQQLRGSGVDVRGQLLVTPATDPAGDWTSMRENATGYVLTRSLMEWFLDHYVDPADRCDPRVAPLRTSDLTGLPPAIVVTCEFDPLRDEGDAYASALAAAGVPTNHLRCRGQIHTSLLAVDMLPGGAPVRAEIFAHVAEWLV